MAGDTDDTDSAADRLEAALERLAGLAAAARTTEHAPAAFGASPPVDEITTRLDGLIDRLRTALGGRPG